MAETLTTPLDSCPERDASLLDVAARRWNGRQVFDLPRLRPHVTEDQTEIKDCPHRAQTVNAAYPEGIARSVQYERLKSTAAYFSRYQLLPYRRLPEVLQDVFNLSVSQGTTAS